jgi:antibiotic biosynthesis monooxygenase (ABM) superfamily enzyme
MLDERRAAIEGDEGEPRDNGSERWEDEAAQPSTSPR